MKFQRFYHEHYGDFRVATFHGEPWFVLSDVCRFLNINRKQTSCVAREDMEIHKISGDEPMHCNFVNVSGLYTLIRFSAVPEADQFKRWMTHDVLPSIKIPETYNNQVKAAIARGLAPKREPKPKPIEKVEERSVNEIQVFKNEQFGEVRTTVIDGNPWFVGKDVATVLGYSNSRKALADHVDSDDKGVTKCDTLGGAQELTIVNESGLYSLIIGSKLPTAKQFKHWVTSEVLPSIRKHGVYVKGQETMTEDQIKQAGAAGIESVLSEKQRLQLELFSRDDYTIAMAHQALVDMETKPLLEKIERDKPLVTWAETAAKSEDNIDMGDMSKILKKDFNIALGRNRLFKLLREQKVLMKDNTPYQQFINRNYFVVKESTYFNGSEQKLGLTTLVTPRGQVWLASKVPQWIAEHRNAQRKKLGDDETP